MTRIGKIPFFILPDDYFEQLSDSCERICIDDIKEIIKSKEYRNSMNLLII